MLALRMTPEKSAPPARRAGHGSALTCLAMFGVGFLLLGVCGCGPSTIDDDRDDPDMLEPKPFQSERPTMATLPPPRAEWIEYSAKDRKLSFYQLRASGRWMVKRSDNGLAQPAGPEVVLPEGLDAAETYVFYQRPGGQVSRSITLAQIQSATREHLSMDR